MDDSPTSKDDLLPDSQRITRFGRLLRSLSFDELPEMINILRGEMSFVGPRPLLMEYLTLYSPAQARRHDVVPGLTGWAQVHGRNALDWQSRLAMDVWYVDHWSFWLDMRIILTTLWKVIRRENINQPGQATVEYFKGNKD
jgi:lipopolysaccharide/colanic/teichoic acid biosynthesis glycosyltransferase